MMSTQARHDGDSIFQKHNHPIKKIYRTIAALLKLTLLLKVDYDVILNIDDDVIYMTAAHAQNVGLRVPYTTILNPKLKDQYLFLYLHEAGGSGARAPRERSLATWLI